MLNVAVTLSAALIVIVQVPVPLQAALPLQPANVLPEFGVAVSVTDAPLVKFAEHVDGHVIPDGLLETVPFPVPASATDNAKVELLLNVAVTDCAAFIVKLHTPVPEQPAPVHPAKVDPEPTVYVSPTCVPLTKLALQPVVLPVVQLIPAGLLVTVPDPVPFTVTDST